MLIKGILQEFRIHFKNNRILFCFEPLFRFLMHIKNVSRVQILKISLMWIIQIPTSHLEAKNPFGLVFSNAGNYFYYLGWASFGFKWKIKITPWKKDLRCLLKENILQSFLLFGTQLIPTHSVLRPNFIKEIDHV